MNKIQSFFKKRDVSVVTGLIIGTTIYCLAIVWILDLGEFYAGGVTGVSQLISTILGKNGINISKSIFIAIINIPLFLIGWKGVSKRFAYLSLVSVVLQIIMIYGLEVLRQRGLDPFASLADQKLLLSILGGLLTGVGCAICLRGGASSGGMDILAQYIALKKNISFTKFSMAVDFIIIVASGIVGGSINVAVFTVVRLITHIVALDKIHTIYKYMKISIITTQLEEMKTELLKKFNHGITIFQAVGGYTGQPRWVLESVVLAYEIEEYRALAKRVDQHVFVSYVTVNGIEGNFNRNVIA
ncbi:MAG: YitT family protein [Bacilli bacterium]|nr:YitT family protein [Bacilli bacterium]